MGQSSSLLHANKDIDVLEDGSSEEEVDPLVATTRADMLLEVMRLRCVNSVSLQEATVAPVLKNCLAEDWPYAKVTPRTVLLQIYDLPEFQGANEALSFAIDEVTLGGAFHTGVEVFGNEWSYGSEGVKSGVPRASADHTYRCSIPLGETKLTTLQVASMLHRLCQKWRGGDYELLGHNCCSFASELVGSLGVGQIPDWVDRFPRLLDQGRTVGHLAVQVGEVLWEGLGGFDGHVVRGPLSENQAQQESQAFELQVTSVEERNLFLCEEPRASAPAAAPAAVPAAAAEAEAALPAPRGPFDSQSQSTQDSLAFCQSCSASSQEEDHASDPHTCEQEAPSDASTKLNDSLGSTSTGEDHDDLTTFEEISVTPQEVDPGHETGNNRTSEKDHASDLHALQQESTSHPSTKSNEGLRPTSTGEDHDVLKTSQEIHVTSHELDSRTEVYTLDFI